MQPEFCPTGLGRRTLLGAKIIFNDRSSIIDCVLRRISDHSAELRMHSTVAVPGSFQLVIKPHDEVLQCEIAWRSETDIGVTIRSRTAKAAPLRRARPYESY